MVYQYFFSIKTVSHESTKEAEWKGYMIKISNLQVSVKMLIVAY